MSTVFNDITSSLNELAEHAQGKETGIVVHRRTSQDVIDIPVFTPQEIRDVRIAADMSQKTFAACVGVSVKSVEAWEGGRSRPDGAARRVLGLMKSNPKFAEEMGLLVTH
jgi:putative transcriptional regulator